MFKIGSKPRHAQSQAAEAQRGRQRATQEMEFDGKGKRNGLGRDVLLLQQAHAERPNNHPFRLCPTPGSAEFSKTFLGCPLSDRKNF